MSVLFACFLLALLLVLCYDLCMREFLTLEDVKEWARLDRELLMANDRLVNVPPTERVSDAEVEQFRLEKFAEKNFISGLRGLVAELQLKVSPRNPVLASMQRFLRGR